MTDDVDADTGELFQAPALSIGARAATASAQAKVQLDRDRVGYRANGLHDAIERAMKDVPSWIKATQSSGRGTAKYATLKDILEVVRPRLMMFGVRIRQGAEMSRTADEGGGSKGRLVPVYTDLVDTRSGDYERTIVEIPLVRLDPQAMGSAVTYGKRYSLLAALGLATDEADDDGERAKTPDIKEKHEESDALIAIKAEIAAAKDATKLYEWGDDAKQKKRLAALSEGELVLARQAYKARVQVLLSVDEGAPEKKK